MQTLLIPKETKAGETRVGLTPNDVQQLIAKGFTVIVEADAGKGAGYSNQAYLDVGAEIRPLTHDNGYHELFKDIDIVLRCKRPDQAREIAELKAIQHNTVMVAAFDPFEHNGEHLQQYHAKGVATYSIDQAQIASNHPMNILAAMSKMAGRLAFESALALFSGTPRSTLIIGAGSAGVSAALAAQHINPVTVIARRDNHALQAISGDVVIFPASVKHSTEQQAFIEPFASNADIIITTARSPGKRAPILLAEHTLAQLKPGTVIVDLALSEGGNVIGSQHDQTIRLDNGVIITNESGYPKKYPREASELWSAANLNFMLKYHENQKDSDIHSCLV